jgi:hypothetical protein
MYFNLYSAEWAIGITESFKQKVERLKLQIPEDFSWSFPLLQLCLFEHKRSSGQGADPKMQYV